MVRLGWVIDGDVVNLRDQVDRRPISQRAGHEHGYADTRVIEPSQQRPASSIDHDRQHHQHGDAGPHRDHVPVGGHVYDDAQPDEEGTHHADDRNRPADEGAALLRILRRNGRTTRNWSGRFTGRLVSGRQTITAQDSDALFGRD